MTFATEFLRYPDLFPARDAGDAWGDRSFQVDLPGGPYLVSGLSAEQFTGMERRYESCRGTPEPAQEADIRVFFSDPGDFISFERVGWEYTVDLDPRPTVVRLAAPYFMARLERGPEGKATIWTCENRTDSFIGVIENVLRPMVASRLLARGGLLLHSSAVVVDDRCFLFVGHSGAGKSTIAGLALARGLTVLSDDLNFVLPDNSGWVSRRMPFSGDHQSNADGSHYTVRGIVRLEHGAENQVRTLTPADAFSLLLASSPYVNTDPYLSERLDSTVHAMVNSLPSWGLTFRKDTSVWTIIEEL